ncbi:MAG: zinc-ribbon domain-containing protein, partial [Microthrixaceae bacterium]
MLDGALTHHSGQESAAVFPKVVRLARTLTSPTFVARLFNPRLEFREALSFLEQGVERVMGAPAPAVARRVWLYLRPTFAELRSAMMRGEAYSAQWPHDFPLDESVATIFLAPDEWPPFNEFLEASGDTPETAMRADLGRNTARLEPGPPANPGSYAVSKFVCEHGHHTQVRHYLHGPPAVRARSSRAPKCGVCANRIVERGQTDLASVAPNIAPQLDVEMNDGLTAAEVPAKSNRKLFWRCPKGHSYQATPANRVLNKSGCPICQNRVIVAGINCLSTTHPAIAAEWHPAANYGRRPTEFSAGSNTIITWLCSD